MASVSAPLSPGGARVITSFVALSVLRVQSQLASQFILNFRFVDPIGFIGYLCFNFQDWLILPFRQKSSAHNYPCIRETGAQYVLRGGGCVTPFPGLV